MTRVNYEFLSAFSWIFAMTLCPCSKRDKEYNHHATGLYWNNQNQACMGVLWKASHASLQPIMHSCDNTPHICCMYTHRRLSGRWLSQCHISSAVEQYYVPWPWISCCWWEVPGLLDRVQPRIGPGSCCCSTGAEQSSVKDIQRGQTVLCLGPELPGGWGGCLQTLCVQSAISITWQRLDKRLNGAVAPSRTGSKC